MSTLLKFPLYRVYRSARILEYLGEYKILPLFLPTQKSPKTHERHHGWKGNNNGMQQSNKTEKQQQ